THTLSLRASLAVALVGGLAGLVACGSDSGAGPTATSSSSAAGGSGAGGSAPSWPQCPGTEPANADEKVNIGNVTVQILEVDGDPVKDEDVEVQLCGTDLCLYGTVGSDGHVSMLDHDGKSLVDPVFKYGGHGNYVWMGGRLETGGDV